MGQITLKLPNSESWPSPFSLTLLITSYTKSC